MIAIPNELGIILTGCISSLGKIYQLAWNSNGDELQWSTLHDNVIQRSYSPVLMWITDELRDELTTCQYKSHMLSDVVIIGADYQITDSNYKSAD